MKYDGCKMILLGEYPCNSKHELEARERHHIENTPSCVNKQHPGRTNKEYYNEMKEQMLVKVNTYGNYKDKMDEHKKQHYTEHEEHFQNYKQEWCLKDKDTHGLTSKERIMCECGIGVYRGYLQRHLQTDKHIKLSIPSYNVFHIYV